jgi:tellurite resistance protein
MGNPVVESDVSALLSRVTRQLRDPSARGSNLTRSSEGESSSNGSVSTVPTESVLVATAARYCPPAGDFAITPPTGFDVEAGALFEAIVESAFLVANADGTFDEEERNAFAKVVFEASGYRVTARQIEAIVKDLATQLEEDGFEKRVTVLGQSIKKYVHRREALLIAALLAWVSAGVSPVERRALEKIAVVFELPESMVDEVLGEVRRSLAD